jgi:hypothetical protein
VTDTPPVRVGVALPPPTDDLRAWLSEAVAFDAAGADAIWCDLRTTAGLDPYVLTTALATLTARTLIVVSLPDAEADAVDTIRRLSRDRLRVVADATATVDDLVWLPTAFPHDRTVWRTTRDEVPAGHALVVPADPRLLDLLRNPDDHGDRSDLRLSVG